MLARTHRFHGHHSVMRVRGKSVRFAHGRIVYALNSRRTDYRVAVVVSKKVAKSAVTRNRIRRRLFEAIRVSKRLEGVNADVVVLVSDPGVKDVPATDLFMQIDRVCAQISAAA